MYKTTQYYIVLPLTIISILTVVFASILFSEKINLINYLGRYSLEVYLMHILAASGIRIILYDFCGIDNIFLHLFFGVIGGLFFPIVLLKVFNKKIKFLFYLIDIYKK